MTATDVNIYLAIYIRRLRPDVRIVARANLDRNVSTLYRAGADDVLSYASMGANIIFNLLRSSDTLLLAEGVSVFSVPVPRSLRGLTLAESRVPALTGCSIVAIEADGRRELNLSPETVLPPKGTLILIGSVAGEEKFLDAFPS